MTLEPDTSLGEVSDEQLVERYRMGQVGAFEVLMRRYEQELFHFLVRFIANRAVAEEVFQEVFLQVHISADAFDTSRRFKPWLFTIAANKARDYLRRNSRRHAVPMSALAAGDDGRSHVDLLESDLPLPAATADARETRELVQAIIADMPDHLREVLLLAYFQQFAYKEIAQMLDIPLGTVKSRLHAAVGTFADRWKQHQAEQAGNEPNEPKLG